jgi:hypothetical protein
VWWLFAGVVVVGAFLVLAVLATMREVTILRGEVAAAQQLVMKPPAPSYAVSRGRIPLALIRAVGLDSSPSEFGMKESDLSPRPLLLAFVGAGCRPCQALTSGIAMALAQRALTEEDLVFLVWGANKEEASRYAEGLPGRVILDPDADLQRAGEIRGTPTLLSISRPQLTVIDYNLEGEVEWVIRQLSPPKSQIELTQVDRFAQAV